MNDRMKYDTCLFRKDCWEWPEDLGMIKTKKDETFDIDYLCLISGKSKNFSAEHIEVFELGY